jgi:hypothetical protein
MYQPIQFKTRVPAARNSISRFPLRRALSFSTLRTLLDCFALAICALALVATANAQSSIIVGHDLYHDLSLPVREYASSQTMASSFHPLEHPRPLRRPLPGPIPAADAAEQTSSSSTITAPLILDFDGIPNVANGTLVGVPSDSNLSVGATQVVEIINTAYEVFDKKTGQSLFPPQQVSTLFTGVPGLCGQGVTFFFTDPIVVYDKIADRWVISIVAADNTFTTGNECIAVSATSDATGRYYRYAFSFGNNAFNDYPKLAVWPDAYYASYNLFTPTTVAGTACAYDRARMILGESTTVVCFANQNEFAFLPSDLDGKTLPPAGEPNFFVDLSSTSSLHLYRFHVDFGIPLNSTFTGPINIPVKPFAEACGGGICIPQQGTKQQLDSLGDRLMFRLAYRNFSSHESLVVNHSVQTKLAAAGVRWYEIRDPNGTPDVFQQSTFTDGDSSVWMASIAMDKEGDIGLGFSQSSSEMHPAIAYTGRLATDPLDTMELPALIVAGNGSQIGVNRWGDYSGLSIDPVDDCTFWYVNQYYRTNSGFKFHTRVASFKFPTCH